MNSLLRQLKHEYTEYADYALTLNGKCLAVQKRKALPDNDVRENIYKQLYKVVWPYVVGFKFLITELFSDVRFRTQFMGISDEARKDTIIYYELFLRNGLIYNLSSITESGIRSIFRVLNPKKKGVGYFKNQIISPLYSQLGINKDSNQAKALELLVEVRNSIHNNGIFLHPKGTSLTIVYRGIEHRFLSGKSHQSATRGLLLSIIRDIESLFDLIFSRKEVRLYDFIPDVIASSTDT